MKCFWNKQSHETEVNQDRKLHKRRFTRLVCCWSKQSQETEVKELNADNLTEPNVRSRPTSASQVSPEITSEKQCNQNRKLHESCLSKQKANDARVNELLEQMKKKEENIATLEKTKTHQSSAIEQRDQQLSTQDMKIKSLEEENESLLLRLSKMVSAKLTDGNANIADLSDENRPTKLADKYSELYDNEWTDAFDVLTKSGESEENSCLTLLKIICTTYITCRDKANKDFETMTDAMDSFLGGRQAAPELIKPFKDQRKKMFKGHEHDLKKDLKKNLKQLWPDKRIRKDPAMKKYIYGSLELCWLMVIQDPSVFMDVNIKRSGEKYDSDKQKPYTQSGDFIDFIVWPPLYLQEKGSVLCKGVAQCKKVKTQEQTQTTGEQSTARSFQRKKESHKMDVNSQEIEANVPHQTFENIVNKHNQKQKRPKSPTETDREHTDEESVNKPKPENNIVTKL